MMNNKIFKKVTVGILLYLYQHSSRPQSLSTISKGVDSCMSATPRIVHLLGILGFFKIERKGHKLYIDLTNKGKEVARLLEVIICLIQAPRVISYPS